MNMSNTNIRDAQHKLAHIADELVRWQTIMNRVNSSAGQYSNGHGNERPSRQDPGPTSRQTKRRNKHYNTNWPSRHPTSPTSNQAIGRTYWANPTTRSAKSTTIPAAP